MPLMNGLRVVRSSIHGYGVIATKPIYTGQLVMYGDGVLYRESDDFDDTYALITPAYESENEDGPPMFLDLACQGRWINHSCDPNTLVDTRWIKSEKRVEAWWTCIRDIAPGDELTYDYAFSAEVAEVCLCGASSCRGVIVDVDERDLISPELRGYLRAG
jgi:hypothetical protein